MINNETELKDFIQSNFNDLKKNNDETNKKLVAVENSLTTEIKLIKNDLSWIKWLFGIFSSLIVVLLGTILTVLFKLLENL